MSSRWCATWSAAMLVNSRAKGTHMPRSDVDLAVTGDVTPLAGLSALLRSEAMQDVLAILSGRTRQRFVDELTAIADVP